MLYIYARLNIISFPDKKVKKIPVKTVQNFSKISFYKFFLPYFTDTPNNSSLIF